MGCAASTGPLYRDEHDFATTAAYYDKDEDVKKDWVENEQLGEGMFDISFPMKLLAAVFIGVAWFLQRREENHRTTRTNSDEPSQTASQPCPRF